MRRDAARTKMVKARSELVLDHPFFANLALRLEMREDSGCRTAWSDGRVLAYNPAYIDMLPLEKVKGLQCHEVLHLACLHHTRRQGREKTLWNRACDYAINPILLEAGITLPDGFLNDPAFYDKSVDAIYSILADQDQEPNGGADTGAEQESAREADADADAAQSQTAQQEDGEGAPAEEEPPEEELRTSGNGGPGEEGAADSSPETDPGMSGEVRDAASDADSGEGRTDSGQEEDSWRIALSQAVQQSQMAGELPGSIERLFSELLAPKLPWTELLRRFLASSARNDFSWVQPNRRYLHAGLYLPGLHNEELGEIAIAVDTSGSITQPELNAFATELSAILEEFDTVFNVFTCDAAVTGQFRLTGGDLPLEFLATGGGGTDFRPPFAWLEQDGICPQCLIYFSDLQCDRYPEEPAYPVLWVCPRDAFLPPPFGETLILEEQP